jgi:hypothetical protein
MWLKTVGSFQPRGNSNIYAQYHRKIKRSVSKSESESIKI